MDLVCAGVGHPEEGLAVERVGDGGGACGVDPSPSDEVFERGRGGAGEVFRVESGKRQRNVGHPSFPPSFIWDRVGFGKGCRVGGEETG